MADPLSITASIISIIGAADTVRRTLNKVKTLKNAPADVLALHAEISDLTVVLDDVNFYIADISETEEASTISRRLQCLAKLLDRAKTYVLDLDSILHYQLVRNGSLDEGFKVSRVEWLRAKSTVESIRHRLRDVRQNIAMQMMSINSLYQSRIHTMVGEVSLVANNTRMHQVCHQETLERQLNEQIGLINSIQMVKEASGRPTESFIKAATNLQKHQFTPCAFNCICKCHAIRSYKSPPSLESIFGKLSIGYTGCSAASVPTCDTATCDNKVGFNACVNYFLPSWLCTKLLSISLANSPLGEPSAYLVMRRVVPSTAKIFQLAYLDDGDGIKRLISTGLASPMDMDVKSGRTALHYAALYANTSACQALLDAGADPLFHDNLKQSTAWDYSWSNILAGSVDKGMLETLKMLFPDHGQLEKYQHPKLHKIILGLDASELETELVNSTLDVNAVDSNGRTALFWAAKRGDIPMTEHLLRAKADPNLCDNNGDSPLLQSTSLACSKMLLQAGANVRTMNRFGLTALFYAHVCNADNAYMSAVLAPGISLSAATIYGDTPLHMAAGYGCLPMLEALLHHGAEIDALNDNGESPLSYSLNGYLMADDAAQCLLNAGADYTIIDKLGRTILHQAGLFGTLRSIKILRTAALKGIDTEIRDQDGNTALEVMQQRVWEPDELRELFRVLLSEIRTRNGAFKASNASNIESPKRSDTSDCEPADIFVDAPEQQA